jgi:peptide/nickel transport system substrate-binding protein
VPWDAYWDEIDVFGTLNQETALMAVAKGEYDLYWNSVPYNEIQSVIHKYGKNLQLIKSVANWLSLDFNLVGDPKTGLVNASGKVIFNPFALRRVRYAMNFLVSREFIVSNILHGSGAPIYGPIATGQVNASIAMQIVANALGITAHSNEAYGMKLVNEAMESAAKHLKEKGYILVKKDGKWYFGKSEDSLEPVTINLIAPVNDPQRLDEGKYLAGILEKVGFKVNLIKATGRQTHIVHHSNPKVASGNTLRWSLYTEGWFSSHIHSILSIAWHLWVFDYYIAPNRGARYHDPVTLKELVGNVSHGDLNKFIKVLRLQYYTTPDKVKPFLPWSAYDFAHLLAFNTWTGPNNYTVTVTNLPQFWDLYKFGYGTHILDSPHVYIAKVYTFYILTKRVKVGVLDPVTGIGSFFAIRSVQPAAESQAQTSSAGQQSASPTSSASKKKGGICGPAFIVGLAMIPLLRRRR